MEFFSFMNDDLKFIANIYSGKSVKTVYLLPPRSKPPVREDRFEGSRIFEGTCC